MTTKIPNINGKDQEIIGGELQQLGVIHGRKSPSMNDLVQGEEVFFGHWHERTGLFLTPNV